MAVAHPIRLDLAIMTHTTIEILDRLQACEMDLEAHRGYLKAFEYGLRALIISHPSPPQLLGLWNVLLPSITETHLGTQGVSFTLAFQQALSLLTKQIEDSREGDDRSR